MSSSAPRDRWPVALAALHLAHSLWFASLYPDGVHDPDLLAYFVYFANWLTGTTALHAMPYFTVPKPLLVFVLGPLASAQAAFVVSAVCSALLGVVVYEVGRRAFDRTTGILFSLVLLLDVDRAVLALHSSGDFYVTLLLFAAILCTQTRRYRLSGLAVALAALVKPVALPCAAHLLAIDGPDRRRAWTGAAIPLLAVPLILASNLALLGSPIGPERFFAGFDAMSQGELMPTGELVRFVVWVQLAKHAFVATAPIGFVGLASWLAADSRRLSSPLLLVPMLFLGGYVALSLHTPFVPFFRFFWPVQVCFLGFVTYGAVEIARRLAPEHRRLRLAVCAALALFLVDDLMTRQLHYRHNFAQPFQDAMAFVEQSRPVMLEERTQGESVLTPLVFLPYVLWTLEDTRSAPSLVATAEHDGPEVEPDWILWVPRAFLDQASRERVGRLIASGRYERRFAVGEAALLARVDRPAPLARRAPPPPPHT
jgi:hypothetical protein